MSQEDENNNYQFDHILNQIMTPKKAYTNLTYHLMKPVELIYKNSLNGRNTTLKEIKHDHSNSINSDQSLKNFLYFRPQNSNEATFSSLVDTIFIDKKSKEFKFKF